MLYLFKGINADGYIVRGTVQADNPKDAIRKVKSVAQAEVIIDIQRSFDSPKLNKVREKYLKTVEEQENKSRERTWKKELRKIQRVKARIEKKNSDKRSENKFLLQIEKWKSKFPSLAPRKVATEINIDDEMVSKLENLFADKAAERNALNNDDNFDEKIEEYEKALQIEERVKNRLREKVGDKEINWDLIKEPDSRKVSKNFKIKVKPAEIFLFTRRLHIMLSSGVSLLNALILLRDSSTPGMAKIIDEVVSTIQAGNSLSEALSRFPKQFNHVYVALVSVGENSGSLERCLKDVLALQEQQMMVKKKVKSALVYPATIGVVLVALLIFGSLYFIPEFEGMFREQGMKLPLLTEIVFTIAGFIPYILSGAVLIIMVTLYLKKRYASVDRKIKQFTHKLMLKLPVVKKVANANYMFTFASTVALMLGNGIRLKDTLGLAYRTIGNIYIKNGIMGASALMVRGSSFSEALKEQPHFDKILINIVETGEESGRMTFSLEQIANYFKEDLERQIAVLLELVQPVSILLVALLIGPVIIAVYMPILEMSSGALGGI